MINKSHKYISILTGLLAVVLSAQAADVVWVSSNASQKWQQMASPTLVKGSPQSPPIVRIEPSKTYQTIDGFGGCFNELGWTALNAASSSNQTAVLDSLFSTNGCAFTLGRIPIGASDFATNAYSLDDTPGDYALTNFSIARDQQMLIPYIKAAMAVQTNLQCWGSPWSPPAWMKTNSYYAGGAIRWEPPVLQSYANYFVRWIQAYRGEGINIYAVIPQNEPNISSGYPSCIWSGTQLRDFIGGYLGPTLVSSNANVELWLGINGDPINGGDNINDRIKTVLEDATANGYTAGVGFQYDSQTQIGMVHEWFPSMKLIQTETKCYSGSNSWSDAQDLYANMLRYFDNGANAYFAWNMILNETGLSSWGWQQNAMVTVNSSTGQVTYNGEYYVMRHFSQYVQPGAKRVMTTGWWGDKIAFENPDGSVVLVMGNSLTTTYDVSITVAGRTGNDTINVTLPAASINTFVFAPELASAPLPPSSLVGVAQNGQAVLDWSDASGATSYNLKRALVSGGPYTVIASNLTSTVFTNTDLVNGTTYYYVVSAVNTYGEGTNSTQVAVTPQVTPKVATLLNISDSTYPTACTVADYQAVGVTNLTGSETISQTAPAIGSSLASSYAFSGGEVMTLSDTANGGAYAKNTGPGNTSEGGLLDLYLYTTTSTARTMTVSNLNLSPNSTYTLYLIGYIPNNTPAEDGLFTPVNTPNITFASTASGQGVLSTRFTTSASYANTDTLQFTWARAAASGDGVFSGLAIVPVPVATNATNIVYSVSGGKLTLSWPADHIGWRLQVQTNNLATGLNTNWFDVPTATTTNRMILPVDLQNGSVFYRLAYP